MSGHFPRSIRINKPQDIRRMLAKVINILLQDGEMTTDKAKTIATLSNTALKSMDLGELSDRLEKIEEQLQSQEGGRK
ncbi:hypothetical protein JMM81_21305 [Bacillus sp. V3B]|uniref:hypothetical protein n=1 Tax=Bacillus sp. V3B TaxID=2804915 RepID=UPI00210D7AAB|nr:hypothetical protein [Bacillus sp. V3B]MCQ6277408.1 hypothetical protein [Bacillus sp. V3B]